MPDQRTPEPTASQSEAPHAFNSESNPGLENAAFVDDTECAPCHQEIYDSYQSVAMSKSFYDFDATQTVESFQDNYFFHEASGNHYEMKIVGKKLQVHRYRQRSDGTRYGEHRQPVDFVVGSGNHVRTYLYRNEIGELYQLPVVWYSQDQKWGMAPGYDRPDHPDFDRPITRQCMFCHNAYPEFEPGSDAFGKPQRFPEKLPQGIGCQRCHGPGSEHIRLSSELDVNSEPSKKRIQNSIVNSARLSADLQDDVCNQCHFQPMSQRTSFVRRFGHGDYGFRAGQRLGEYMIHFEPDRDNESANHFEINHHPYRLYQSQCYIKSPGGIRCTDCHDPHQSIAESDRSAHYRQKCFSCHDKLDCQDIQRGRKPDADCVSCHMRPRRTTDVVNVTMTDHKISRRSSLENPVAELKEIDVPIEMPIREYQFAHRQAAKAPPDKTKRRLYELFSRALDDDESVIEELKNFLSGSSGRIPTEASLQLAQMQLQYQQFEDAANTLESIDTSWIKLAIPFTHLGVAQTGMGKYKAAQDSLNSAVLIEPTDSVAWYNLGVAQQRANDLDAAVNSLQKAVRLNPSYFKALRKLGNVLARLGKRAAAIDFLKRALAIKPDDRSTILQLAAAYRASKQFSKAINTLKNGASNPNSDQLVRLELVWLLIDPANSQHGNPERATELADKELAMAKNATTVLTKTITLLQTGQNQQALDFLGKHLEMLEQESRKPESGLLLAICQSRLQSEDSANQNYAAAGAALRARRTDRLGKLVQNFADSVFKDD